MHTRAGDLWRSPPGRGLHELGGLDAWGQWSVGNWCKDVQGTWIRQDL